jgi:hypothetical protein
MVRNARDRLKTAVPDAGSCRLGFFGLLTTPTNNHRETEDPGAVGHCAGRVTGRRY